ncbi:hypothetical protein [Peribacillus muralis]|uniref:hypothetical protein n=1 Tax=Peribacillus muralis TaxID=264697 RepID=UPI003D017F07
MLNYKKFTVVLLVLGSLAACDNEQVTKNEQVDAPKQNEVQDSTETNKKTIQGAYEADPKNYITGGWMNDESYITIINEYNGGKDKTKFILEKVPKKGYEKILKHFQVTESSTGNKLTAVIFGKESNRTSFLTLELNKDKTEITITMPNENPITYKETKIEPDEFNPEYEDDLLK